MLWQPRPHLDSSEGLKAAVGIMKSEEQVREALSVWRSADEKLDYHITATASALTAWAVQTINFIPGWPTYLQGGGIASLILAVGSSLIRLQYAVHIYSLSVGQAKAAAAVSKTVEQERNNHTINRTHDTSRINAVESAHKSYGPRINSSRRAAIRAYHLRNYALVIGLGLYASGRFIALS